MSGTTFEAANPDASAHRAPTVGQRRETTREAASSNVALARRRRPSLEIDLQDDSRRYLETLTSPNVYENLSFKSIAGWLSIYREMLSFWRFLLPGIFESSEWRSRSIREFVIVDTEMFDTFLHQA